MQLYGVHMMASVKPKMEFLSSIAPHTGLELLRSIGGAPWSLVSHGELKSFPSRKADDLERWVETMQGNSRSVLFHLPTHAGAHWFVAARAPMDASPATCRIRPHVVIQSTDWTLLWRLASPVSTAVAEDIARELVAPLGGKPAIGQPIPLPGTFYAAKPGARAGERVPVLLMRGQGGAPLHVEGGRLVPMRASTASAPVNDPRLLTVELGAAEDGTPLLWQPGRLTNGFAIITGGSGSGKTGTMKTWIDGIHRWGVPVLTIDLHGDMDVPGVKTVLLSSGTESVHGLNPMELDCSDTKRRGIGEQVAALHGMIMQGSRLGHVQGGALEDAIWAAYADVGIIKNDPSSWGRTPPTPAGLLAKLAEDGGNRGLYAGVSKLFGHEIFQRDCYLPIGDILQHSTRLDLSELPDHLQFAATDTLLRQVFRTLRMRGHIPESPADDRERFRLFVAIDEAAVIAKGGAEKNHILNVLVTQARKFGLGLIAATQMVDDFSSEMRANAATSLVLYNRSMDEARRNAGSIGIDPAAITKLRGKGDGYYRDSANPETRRVQIRKFDPAPKRRA